MNFCTIIKSNVNAIEVEHTWFAGFHLACVSTAVGGTDATRCEVDVWHYDHRGPVVATEEGAHIIDARTVPSIVGIEIATLNGIGDDIVACAIDFQVGRSH